MNRITQSYRNGKTHFIAIPFQLETSKGTNSEVEAGFEWMKLRSLNQLPSQRELGRRWGWTLIVTGKRNGDKMSLAAPI